MNDGYYRSRMADVKQKREFINHEGWKYVSSYKYKKPFYKTLFTKLFSIKKFENRLEPQTKGKRGDYGEQSF
ncbi:hypothetical protein ACDX78_19955 [Virgibacillus oceani]